MEVLADYQQVVGEVKERNRFFHALNQVRGIAIKSMNDQTIPENLKHQFELIIQECDKALK